jgi:hypothetical protein
LFSRLRKTNAKRLSLHLCVFAFKILCALCGKKEYG